MSECTIREDVGSRQQKKQDDDPLGSQMGDIMSMSIESIAAQNEVLLEQRRKEQEDG